MKKFLALILALTMGLSLAACGGDDTPTQSGSCLLYTSTAEINRLSKKGSGILPLTDGGKRHKIMALSTIFQ